MIEPYAFSHYTVNVNELYRFITEILQMISRIEQQTAAGKGRTQNE